MITIQKVTSDAQSVPCLSSADRQCQCQEDTRLTLTPSGIPNSNYVIMASDLNCLKCFYVFLYCNHQVHRDFLITLYETWHRVGPYPKYGLDWWSGVKAEWAWQLLHVWFLYEVVSKIFRTGADIYTTAVVARSTGSNRSNCEFWLLLWLAATVWKRAKTSPRTSAGTELAASL
jgi:hypothetical protein